MLIPRLFDGEKILHGTRGEDTASRHWSGVLDCPIEFDLQH